MSHCRVHPVLLATVLLPFIWGASAFAQPTARSITPDGMMSAADAETLERDLDAFFVTADIGKRKDIYEQQLIPHHVGLTLDELTAMDAPAQDKPGAGGVFRLKAPGGDSDSHGFFNLAVPAGYTPKKSWPLLVVLHGHGGSGDELVGAYVPPMTNAGYFVLFPGTTDNYWSTTGALSTVYRQMEWVARRFRIDMRRMVVSGVSMGGMGTWSQLRAMPELWSAGASLIAHAGIVEGPSFDRVRGIPVYVVQGEKDPIAKVEDTRRMINELKSRHIDYVYIEMPGVGHAIPTEQWPKLHAWIAAQPAKPWSPRPILLPTDGSRPLWQATEDPFGLNDANDPVASLLKAGDARGAQAEVRKQLLHNKDVARLYVLRALAMVPPLLEPTPSRLDPANLTDGASGWGAAAEDAALSSLRLAINSRGKGSAERRFDAEVNHLIARIWAKRFATTVGQGGQAWVTRFNNFGRYARLTQDLQPGHRDNQRLIEACNALLPKP